MAKHLECKVRLLDEVWAMLVGLTEDTIQLLYNKYSILTDNYFFNPLYKLGQWDGKIHFFQPTGKTYVYLLEEILPILTRHGYKIVLDDLRTTAVKIPSTIDNQIFAHIPHLDTGKPTILRDDQVQAVNALIEAGNGICLAGTGAGKAQALTSKVLTPSGWKSMGDMSYGDVVTAPNGSTANIVGIFPQGPKQLYRITFHDGASTLACAEHLWSAKIPVKKHTARSSYETINTLEMLEFLTRKNTGVHTPGNISIPLCEPIPLPTAKLSIDPYILGVLIGDGSLSGKSPMLSNTNQQLLDRVAAYISTLGLSLKRTSAASCDYRVTKQDTQNSFPPSPNVLTVALTSLNLMGTKSNSKFIPNVYLRSSVDQRWEILRGLMDTDGTVDTRGNTSFTTVSKQLASDVQQLAWSLGCTCTIRTRTPTYQYASEKLKGQLAYTCFIRCKTPKALFYVDTKKNRCRELHANGRIELMRRVVSIVPTAVEPAQCIMLDSAEHLYVTDDYIVTHNTLMCSGLVKAYSDIGIKTLTIVPDGGLIRQTKAEYINCGLDAGEYSGTKKDLEHQHVVSTWQSLKNNPKIVLMFQMVIVDECHGARGNILQKILTSHAGAIPYRFGFTGTLPKSNTERMAVHAAVGPIRHTMMAATLIEMGVLAKIDIDVIQLEENLNEEYQQYLVEERELTSNSKPPTYSQFKDSYFGDFVAEKSYLHRNETRIEWIAELLQLKAEQGNVMCLVDSITLGRQLAAFIPGSVFVNGKDIKTPAKRAAVYDLFKTRDDFIMIATVHIAGTGLSINRIHNLVSVDIGKSFIRVVQGIGRGLRKGHDKDEVTYTDICSDLKYSKRHLTERINYYKEQKYPYKKRKVEYIKPMTLDENL